MKYQLNESSKTVQKIENQINSKVLATTCWEPAMKKTNTVGANLLAKYRFALLPLSYTMKEHEVDI